MKRLLLHIFLLSYTVVIFKPVLPFVTDAVNHIFFYAHHMATMHYENGRYHVHYEMAQQQKDEQHQNNNNALKKDQQENWHLPAVRLQQVVPAKQLINVYSNYLYEHLTKGITDPSSPPPDYA